jgi:phospholipase C
MNDSGEVMAIIDHVIVLMLENRSFDSMLGRLHQPPIPTFDGLTGNESNMWNGAPVQVNTRSGTDPAVMKIPDPGPREDFIEMNEQIFGVGAPDGSPANMSGFVANYMKDHPERNPADVMHGYTDEQVGMMSSLARSFGVSDRWHASAPNQTWPNRFFIHTGTAGGYVNNQARHAPYNMPTIYNRLTEKGRSWRIYYHDVPHSKLLYRLWSQSDNFHEISDFWDDCRNDNLPSYSFIEPRYFPILSHPNDQHPPHDVGGGERLITKCYDAIRHSPAWERTLFVITYDEHGGIYDHVPPPPAVSPDTFQPDGFAFDRYGVRVPAVLISPWIPAGSVIRPPADSPYPFDHTSVLASLRKLFSLGEPLTARDAAAPDFLHALSLPSPTNGGPAELSLRVMAPPPDDLLAAQMAPPNDNQRELAKAALTMPINSARAIEQLDTLRELGPPPMPEPATAAEAGQQAIVGMRRLLKGGAAPPDF